MEQFEGYQDYPYCDGCGQAVIGHLVVHNSHYGVLQGHDERCLQGALRRAAQNAVLSMDHEKSL